MMKYWNGGILEWWNGGKNRETGLRMNHRKARIDRKEKRPVSPVFLPALRTFRGRVPAEWLHGM
jgi:hypothetical protein